MEDIKGKTLNALCIGLIVTKKYNLPLSDLEVFGLKLEGVSDKNLMVLLWVSFAFYLFRYIQRLPGLIGNLLDDFLREKKWEYLSEAPISSSLENIEFIRVKGLEFMSPDLQRQIGLQKSFDMRLLNNFWKRFFKFCITRQYFLNYFLAALLSAGVIIYYIFG